jgi:3-deoxy-manno-octulosonate cytidylyltransferase (CMP-KDO synthetase)
VVLGVIPSRFGAQRFPGKPLALIRGKPLIQHVYERARQSKLLDDVVVATDDQRIFDLVRQFGGKVAMTSPNHPSGTDRVAEVAGSDVTPNGDDIVVNIQGDEPLLRPAMIDELVHGIAGDSDCAMATLACAISDRAERQNPNVVKVVTGISGNALYFSRHDIPFERQASNALVHYKHIGIYAYRRRALLWLVALPPSPLEQAEQLEQLRALENGLSIKVILTQYETVSVDIPADVAAVESVLKGLESAGQ